MCQNKMPNPQFAKDDLTFNWKLVLCWCPDVAKFMINFIFFFKSNNDWLLNNYWKNINGKVDSIEKKHIYIISKFIINFFRNFSQRVFALYLHNNYYLCIWTTTNTYVIYYSKILTCKNTLRLNNPLVQKKWSGRYYII